MVVHVEEPGVDEDGDSVGTRVAWAEGELARTQGVDVVERGGRWNGEKTFDCFGKY